MKVKMTKNFKASEDGIRVNNYREGEVYDLDETLAQNLIDQEVAENSTDSDAEIAKVELERTRGMAPKQPSARQRVGDELVPLGKADKNAEVIRPLENKLVAAKGRRVGSNSELSTLLDEQEKAIEEANEEDAEDKTRTRTKALKGSDYENKALNKPTNTKEGK